MIKISEEQSARNKARATKMLSVSAEKGTFFHIPGEIDEACAEAVADALTALATAERWVPVTERLPEMLLAESSCSHEVLAQTHDGEIVVAFTLWDDGCLVWSSGHERHIVVAWKPLPAPWVAPIAERAALRGGT